MNNLFRNFEFKLVRRFFEEKLVKVFKILPFFFNLAADFSLMFFRGILHFEIDTNLIKLNESNPLIVSLCLETIRIH